MGRAVDRPTRVAADLLESAAAEGARQSRSAEQQLDHWARVGRAVQMRQVAARRRMAAALAGGLPLSDLADDERAAANAELDAAVQERAAAASLGRAALGRAALERGAAVVALDEEGRLVRYLPDGSAAPLEAGAAT